MDKWPYITPLNKGRNAHIRFGTLHIDPVNLFVQQKPWNFSSPHIQLELCLAEGDKRYETFLWYYKPNDDQWINNFPKAFGKYLLSLDIDGDSVNLTVDYVKVGDIFVLDIGQNATIGNLNIKFDGYHTEEYTGVDGRYAGYITTYSITPSIGDNAAENITVEYTNENNREMRSVQWLDHQIEILYASEKFLKLRVRN